MSKFQAKPFIVDTVLTGIPRTGRVTQDRLFIVMLGRSKTFKQYFGRFSVCVTPSFSSQPKILILYLSPARDQILILIHKICFGYFVVVLS